jgi:hypothetical protein
MKKNYIWVFVIAILALIAIGAYNFLTPTYIPKDTSPPVPGPFQFVEPPTGLERLRAEGQLKDAIRESGINPEPYNTNAVVSYYGRSTAPAPKAQAWQYLAAPIKDNNLDSIFNKAVMVMVDSQNAYGNGLNVAYEVSFSEKNQAILSSPKISEPVILDASFADRRPDKSSAFFLVGSCYLCFSGDSTVGCLICF